MRCTVPFSHRACTPRNKLCWQGSTGIPILPDAPPPPKGLQRGFALIAYLPFPSNNSGTGPKTGWDGVLGNGFTIAPQNVMTSFW